LSYNSANSIFLGNRVSLWIHASVITYWSQIVRAVSTRSRNFHCVKQVETTRVLREIWREVILFKSTLKCILIIVKCHEWALTRVDCWLNFKNSRYSRGFNHIIVNAIKSSRMIKHIFVDIGIWVGRTCCVGTRLQHSLKASWPACEPKIVVQVEKTALCWKHINLQIIVSNLHCENRWAACCQL